MGSGERHLLHNLCHHHHGEVGGARDQHQQPHVPKGCLAVMVGRQGEEQQRFVVPVAHLRHPCFLQLLEKAEEEYGFEHDGAIAIPCHVAEFRAVQGLIDSQLVPSPHHGVVCGGGGGGGHHQLFHLLHHNIVGCFRAYVSAA